MLEAFLTTLAVAGAVVASYTDLKKGIIPNYLTFSLISIGMICNAFSGKFLITLKSLVVIFLLGTLFWKLGGWSAGDVKEFMFIASLIPEYPRFLLRFFSPALSWYPFVVTVFVNTFFAIFPFIFIYAFFISIKKGLAREYLRPLADIGKIARNSLIFALIYASISTILGYQIDVARYVCVVMAFSIFFTLFWNSINILRREALQEEKKISELEEGDILAEEIQIRGGKVVRFSGGLMEKIRQIIGGEDIKVIADTRAAGVEKEEIQKLIKLVEEGELEDRIRVKKSMPFAPVILIGLLLSLIFGDIMTMIKY